MKHANNPAAVTPEKIAVQPGVVAVFTSSRVGVVSSAVITPWADWWHSIASSAIDMARASNGEVLARIGSEGQSVHVMVDGDFAVCVVVARQSLYTKSLPRSMRRALRWLRAQRRESEAA